MKPITFPRLSLLLALAAGLSGALALDTITLNSGEVISGTIKSETADTYTLEVTFGKGIKDTKNIKKADVKKVERETPADKEATALLDELKVIPDGLPAAEYDKRIKRLQEWLDKNKVGKYRADVEEALKAHNEELVRVKAGDVKLRGAWITADEAKWNEYNVNARKLRAKMDDLFKANKPLEAYQVASSIENQYPASTDFPPVVEVMKKKLPAVESAISSAITAYPQKDAMRKQSIGQVLPEKRPEMDALIKKQLTDFKAKVAEEKKNKITIPTYYEYDLPSMQASLAAAKKEAERLNTLDTAGMTAANKKFEQGLKDMNAKAFMSAKNNFEIAAKFHSKDVNVKKKVDEANRAIAEAKNKPKTPAKP